MATANMYKQFGCRSSRKMSGSGSKLLETRWALNLHYGMANTGMMLNSFVAPHLDWPDWTVQPRSNASTRDSRAVSSLVAFRPIMCFVARWSWFVFRFSLFVFRFSFFAFRFSLFVFRFSFFAFCFSLFVFRFSLFVIRFLVFPISFFVIRFSLFVFRFSFFAFWHSKSGRISYFDIQNPIMTFELVPSIVLWN